jgi:hypothetical protein
MNLFDGLIGVYHYPTEFIAQPQVGDSGFDDQLIIGLVLMIGLD